MTDKQKEIEKKYIEYAWIKKPIKNMCKEKGSLHKTQEFMSKFFTPEMENKGLLLYHTVGSGKTATALNIMNNFDSNHRVFWITKNSLRNIPYRDITNEPYWHPKMLEKYKENKMPKEYEQKKRLYNKMTKNNLVTMSYEQFDNVVNGNNEIGRELKKRGGDILKNTLLIIDEAHDLMLEPFFKNEKENEIERAIYKSYKESGKDSVKILIMTATPLDFTMRFFRMMNLIIPSEKDRVDLDGERFYKEYFKNNYTELSEYGEERIRDIIGPLISYLNLATDRTTFAQPNIKKIPVNIYKGNKVIKKIRCEKKELSKNRDELDNVYYDHNKLKKIEEIRNECDTKECEKEIKKIEREILKKCKNKTRDVRRDSQYNLVKDVKNSNLDNDKKARRLINTTLFGENGIIPEVYKFENKEFKADVLKEELSKKSAIIQNMINNIKKLDDEFYKKNKFYPSHIIYNHYNGQRGIKIVISAMIANGFNFVINKDAKLEYTPNKNNFGALTLGDIYNKNFAKKTIKRVIDDFNDDHAKEKNKIRILIFDKSFQAGWNAFETSYVHILGGFLNPSEETQVIGRALRYCGQKELPFIENVGWRVDVFNYRTIIAKEDIDKTILENRYRAEGIEEFSVKAKEIINNNIIKYSLDRLLTTPRDKLLSDKTPSDKLLSDKTQSKRKKKVYIDIPNIERDCLKIKKSVIKTSTAYEKIGRGRSRYRKEELCSKIRNV